ncbi:N-acetylmuramidase family protein [Pseudomonas trivialis]|uniref:N-acetylmuramidase family protein n=1 Tax=Pseudomonas trivialis TaxID=200450 RepID=UPI0030D54887
MTTSPDLSGSIGASVGTVGKASNAPVDVRYIQQLFNLIAPSSVSPLVVDGKSGPLLNQRIVDFQKNRLNVASPDGVIDPGGRTFKGLIEAARTGGQSAATVQSPVQAVSDKQPLVTQATCDGNVTLNEADFKQAALALSNGIEVNIIKAFAIVESGGRSGFGPEKFPVLAYERHIFHKYTQKKYDSTHPNLSAPYMAKADTQWRINNKDQATAWQTLRAAYSLDQKAALMSASYGMFQIMGFNFAACGFKDVFDFVAAMKLNAGQQLNAFVGFCSKNAALVKAMKTRDYVGMARNYNGPQYGDYDQRIKKAYEKLQAGQ